MNDIIQTIKTFNAGRDPQRLAMKYQNMRSAPFVFLRATCHLYYQALAQQPMLPASPTVWGCGDLHLENFGTYKGDNRLVYFDINDFDEAALVPACWELVRFISSVIIGHESLGADSTTALQLAQHFLNAYTTALQDGKARWIEREVADKPIRTLLNDLQTRKRVDLLNLRTKIIKGKRVLIIDDKKALATSDAEKDLVTAVFAAFAKTQPQPERFAVLDVARRIAGNGSLGLSRYIVLVQGKGRIDNHFLLDFKQAIPSSLAPYLQITQPAWNNQAQRVVAVQKRMQAISPAFLHAVNLNTLELKAKTLTPVAQQAEKTYILRELQPSEDRVALTDTSGNMQRTRNILANMGQCVAWAQLRSGGRNGADITDQLIAFGHDLQWQKTLLNAGEHMAEIVKQQWKTYSDAYDKGAFNNA